MVTTAEMTAEKIAPWGQCVLNCSALSALLFIGTSRFFPNCLVVSNLLYSLLILTITFSPISFSSILMVIYIPVSPCGIIL